MKRYVLSIDQSTQGTKALIFDDKMKIVARADKPHKQIIDRHGNIEHDPEEIFSNVLETVENVIRKSGIDKKQIAGIGITNQRETTLCWDREGIPLYNAIVWQDGRAKEICERLILNGKGDLIKKITGINVSPYFPAAKLNWLIENCVTNKGSKDYEVFFGTMDTFLIYRLTGGESYITDYSNASRTQLFNLDNCSWDDETCSLFGVPIEKLPMVEPSDGVFGYTDFNGLFEEKIPIHAVMGDSHAALYAQGCINKGMLKATYGTGSSVMMNTGSERIFSDKLISSVAWDINGRVSYVLEGNINYAGAVISWLKDDLGIISDARETEKISFEASKEDTTYLVPAFSGLGAPYWRSDVKASITGMSRTTGRKEIVKSAVESIAYQITDIVRDMETETKESVTEIRTDGGATANNYLMAFQSDILGCEVRASLVEELSAYGVALLTSQKMGIINDEIIVPVNSYFPKMEKSISDKKYKGWKEALNMILTTNTKKEDLK